MIPLSAKETTTLRFRIGDRVMCNCGTWSMGTVVKLFYTQKNFSADMCAPYQIRLDDGRLIYSPADEERVIREADQRQLSLEPENAEGEEELPECDKLPITIVTGFLGAGKTTLVNYILNEQREKKICVIENEFGAVSIDEALVKENLSAAEEIINMDNGCACCTVRGDLVKAFDQLRERKNDFDLILLETTGLADPAPIIKTISSDWSLANTFRIDGVICLVDVKHVLDHLNETREEGTVNEAVQQVAFSDRILLNKTDTVTQAQLAEVKETIHSINTFAEQIECRNSRVGMDKLTDIKSFSLERFDEEMKEYDIDTPGPSVPSTVVSDGEHAHGHGHHEHGHGEDDCGDDCDHESHKEHGHGHAESEEHAHGHAEDCKETGPGHEHGHKEEGHGHEHGHAPPVVKKKRHDLSGVGSVAFTSEAPLKSSLFNRFMSGLLQKSARDIYRSKGVLCFEGEGNKKYVFQGVHEDINFTEAQTEWAEGDPKVSKVVLIGRALDREELERGFNACKVVGSGSQAPDRPFM